MNSNKKPIGILSNTLQTSYQRQIVEGILNEARLLNHPILCFSGGSIGIREHRARNRVYDLASMEAVSKLLVLPGVLLKHSAKEISIFARHFKTLPTVYIGIDVPDASKVMIDNYKGFKDLIHHVISVHNRKKLVFIKGFENNYDSDSRYQAYIDELIDSNLKLDPRLIIKDGQFALENGRRAVACLIDQRGLKPAIDFDAIVAANDVMAIGAMESLLSRNIKVPQDVAVIGFDDYELGRYMDSPLSTVRQPLKNMGKIALRHLISEEPKSKEILLEAKPIIRMSCGCDHRNEPQKNIAMVSKEEQQKSQGFEKREELQKLLYQDIPWSMGSDGQYSQINSLLDDFQKLMKNPQDLDFIKHFNHYILEWIDNNSDVLPWHHFLDKLNQWLLEQSLVLGQISPVQHILNECHQSITRKIERNNTEEQEILSMYLQELSRVETRLKITLNQNELIEIIAENMAVLSIDTYHVLFLDDPHHVSQDFRLVLSVIKGIQQEVIIGKTRFADFEDFYSSLEYIGSQSQHLLVPVTHSHSVFGYIIYEHSGHSLGFYAYESIADHIGSALMGCHLYKRSQSINTILNHTQKELEKEIKVANNIQKAMLPTELIHREFDLEARMETALSIGGDYYDYIPKNSKDWFIIGDVSGHGIHAGLIMMMVQTLIHHCLNQSPDIFPKELINQINPVITKNIKRLGEPRYMTLMILSHSGNGKFTAAGMHLPLLIYRESTKSVEIIDNKGMWMGILDDISHLTQSIEFTLGPGDCLLLYTDGITEAMYQSSPRVMFGQSNLIKAFQDKGHKTAKEIVNHLFREINDYIKDDDVTLFAIKRRHSLNTPGSVP
ncbi:MAG: SpoIIE family protein phosphatase [Spirochaetales bacterium]|nr:SpoIIE family protein phosphatase [Spirochaetales bacterium]